MHEATIAQSILNIISKKLQDTPNTALVSSVHIIIGEFRNVDDESLRFAFDNLKGLYDGCSSCVLETEIIGATANCRGSNHLYHPNPANAFRCTECGDGIGSLVCGEELDVIQIALQSIANEEKDLYARVG